MKKDFVKGCAGLVAMCAAGLLFPVELRSWYFAILAIGAGFAGGCFVANKKLKAEFGAKNPFCDDRRNFDALVLGSTFAWKALSEKRLNKEKPNRVVSYAFYGRSLDATHLILRRTCGLLRKSGMVALIYTWEELAERSVSVADLAVLHPVTLSELGFCEKDQRFRTSYPLFASIVYSACFLLEKYIFTKVASKNAERKSTPSTHIDMEAILRNLEGVAQFCKSKRIAPYFLLVENRVGQVNRCELWAKIEQTLPVYSCRDIIECEDILEKLTRGIPTERSEYERC